MVTFRRLIDNEQLDYYPTPPYATRALFKHVMPAYSFGSMTCLEPACGGGHMSEVLKDHFEKVISTDVENYGYGEEKDFLHDFQMDSKPDWIITNPPYNLATEFVVQALGLAQLGVAIFTRLQFLESVFRYNVIFRDRPPMVVAPFVERVHLKKGEVVRHCGSTCCYVWMVWNLRKYHVLDEISRVVWIPPCRKQLEKDSDYDNRAGNSGTKDRKGSVRRIRALV
jgi:hypothetical protein